MTEIDGLIAELSEGIKATKHGKIKKCPETIHWGHVGDLAHLKSILQEAVQAKPKH